MPTIVKTVLWLLYLFCLGILFFQSEIDPGSFLGSIFMGTICWAVVAFGGVALLVTLRQRWCGPKDL